MAGLGPAIHDFSVIPAKRGMPGNQLPKSHDAIGYWIRR